MTEDKITRLLEKDYFIFYHEESRTITAMYEILNSDCCDLEQYINLYKGFNMCGTRIAVRAVYTAINKLCSDVRALYEKQDFKMKQLESLYDQFQKLPETDRKQLISIEHLLSMCKMYISYVVCNGDKRCWWDCDTQKVEGG